MITTMIKEACKVMPNSYSPYSQFKVAACIRTDKDNLYTGVNVENGSFSLTCCAETSAISNMITAGEQTIKDIVILSHNNVLCPPCGACRQRIYEFSMPGTMVHLCNEKTIFQSLSINELLPLAFDFNP